MPEYAALVASPRALPDGLILVFQHPVSGLRGSSSLSLKITIQKINSGQKLVLMQKTY